MANSQSQKTIAKFPLRLMPSVRTVAEKFSRKEGVSLNQFINVAVAEKLAVLQHEEWVRNRRKPSEQTTARLMAFIDSLPDVPPEPGDELPPGYVSIHDQAKPRKRQA